MPRIRFTHMQLNPRLITKLFLPLSVATAAVLIGNAQAHAEEATRPVRYSSRAADLMIRQPITIAQASGGTITPTTPGGTTSPSTTPGGTITPTTPGGTIQPSPTTPDTTTPGTITPTTPGTITPTTPDTTTPDTTPSTTPGPSQQVAPTGTQELAPGRANRSGSSYLGIGGNIGIGDGDSGLSNSGFAVISKIGLTRDFSVRPSVLLNDGRVTVLAPVTYEFGNVSDSLGGAGGFNVNPYLGLGVGIGTGDDSNTGLLVTGGVDVPVGGNFTATGAVNAVVTGDTAVGILLGVGYNFAGF
jgi:hypothetical protein